MPETNLDWGQSKTHDEYKKHLFPHWKFSKTTFTSSKIGGMSSTYLPGGAGSTVFGKWNGYCLGSGQDKSGMGRWAWQKMRRNGDQVITFITAYRVSQDSKPPGDINAYMQQYNALIKLGHVNPRPKQQFLTDIKVFIQDCKLRGEEIVLTLDANEPLTDPSHPGKETGIAKLFRECQLTDAYEHKHGKECGDTSNHKSHKIDHIGVSDNLLPAIISCGFLPWNDIVFSDHRSGFLKWDGKILFGDTLDDSTAPTSRKLLLCYPERVKKYRTYVEEKFTEQKLFKALDKLIYRVNKKGSWTKKWSRNTTI